MKKYSKLWLFLQSFIKRFINWYILLGSVSLFILIFLKRDDEPGFYILVIILIMCIITMLISPLTLIKKENYKNSLMNIKLLLYRKRDLYNKYLRCLNQVRDKLEEKEFFSLDGMVPMEVKRKKFVEQIEEIMAWIPFKNDSSENKALLKERLLIKKSKNLFIEAVLNKGSTKDSILIEIYNNQEKFENILHEINLDIRLISVKVSERFVL